MKKLYLIFFILVQVFAFGQMDSIQKKFFEERQKWNNDRCEIDRKKAVEDSKTKTIFYINIPAPNGEDFLPEKELTEILKPYEIIFGGTWMGSDFGGYNYLTCYYSKMTEFAEKKFGEKFLEEKIKEALKLFIENNPDKVFDYRKEDMDPNPILIGSKSRGEDKIIIESRFWKKYKLPNSYKKRNVGEYYSYLEANFILDQKGNISNLKSNATFQNDENEKFRKKMELTFDKYIKSLKFQARTYQGYKVKNLEHINIYLP